MIDKEKRYLPFRCDIIQQIFVYSIPENVILGYFIFKDIFDSIYTNDLKFKSSEV